MNYREFQPSPALQPYVSCLWACELNGVERVIEPVMPDGRTEFIVHYERKPRDGAIVPCQAHGVVMAGQIKSALLLEFEPTIGMVAARFKPYGAAALLRDSMQLITDKIIDGRDLYPRDVEDLEEQVVLASTIERRVAALMQFLERKLASHTGIDPYVEYCIRAMSNPSFEYSSAELAARTGLSERQLERRFNEEVGLSPKFYFRIARFQSGLNHLKQNPTTSLTALAHRLNYFDQSHFIRDFKALTGQSPKEFLKAAHQLNDQFLLSHF